MERQRNAKGHFIKTTKTIEHSKKPASPQTKKNGVKTYKYESFIYIDCELVTDRKPDKHTLANVGYQIEELLKKTSLKYGWKLVDPVVSMFYEKKEPKKEADDGKEVWR